MGRGGAAAIMPALAKIRSWGESHDWCGYDPYDALNAPLTPLLTFNSRTGRRLLTQVVKHSPVNLRPVLKIPRDRNAKAIGLVASAYIRIAAGTNDKMARSAARRWLTWLLENGTRTAGGIGWGYNFPVQTRVFGYRRGTPNAIATSFVAQAFAEATVLLGELEWADTLVQIAQFVADALLVDERHPYFRYVEGESELVHNANVLVAATLVRAARVTNDSTSLEIARRAIQTTLEAQRADGSWPYAGINAHSWVDNFHTGYVLESLAECAPEVPEVRDPLLAGLAYWERELFRADGTPKYFPNRIYPIDAHCYAQAVETWRSAAALRADADDRALAAAELLIDRMLDARGFVHFQQLRFWTNKTAFIRWSTAPVFKALAGVLVASKQWNVQSQDESCASGSI